MKKFDIIIVGGGHAGIEAAWITSQFNHLSLALITLPGVAIGSAPCNPSIGGVGKGQVVRELDALGGLMGILADQAGIQFRTLNESKGLAVQSTRVQIDKELYSQLAEEKLSQLENLTIIREKLISVNQSEEGFVLTTEEQLFSCQKMIMTVGTFLNGKLHLGQTQSLGGRIDAPPSNSLGDLFKFIKTRPVRFKTGTPPRILRSSIDTSKMLEQPSDPLTRNFHCLHDGIERFSKQVSCYLTHIERESLEIIRANKELSPMYNGQISGVGARYCPSIEDKAFRYPDRHSHHVFIEPEGINLATVYPSGISSSLPPHVQEAFVKKITGLEQAEIQTYGYAVEYDVVDTIELTLSLEHKEIKGLFFAGQVNGTSGYEEAAGQGLVAGLNAALSCLGEPAVYLSRHDSYIGVMIEDLVSSRRDEPYRLFTARSEDRLYIREDNAIQRMWPYRKKAHLDLDIDRYSEKFVKEALFLEHLLENSQIDQKSSTFRFVFSGKEEILSRVFSVAELLRQAWVNPVDILEKFLEENDIIISPDIIKTVAIQLKYAGYIKRSLEQNEKVKKMESQRINWEELVNSKNISFECRQRIKSVKPATFGQVKRIEGIRPATLVVISSGAL